MNEKTLTEIIRLIPENTKKKMARWLSYEHPVLWKKAKKKARGEEDGIKKKKTVYDKQT